MQSKNKKAPPVADRQHIERVKSLPCSVCDQAGPSDCHELEQGLWHASIPLCRDCHMGWHNGIHGQKRIWNVKRMTELIALDMTVQKLMEAA